MITVPIEVVVVVTSRHTPRTHDEVYSSIMRHAVLYDKHREK